MTQLTHSANKSAGFQKCGRVKDCRANEVTYMGKHAIRALIVEDNQDIMANLFTFLEGKGYELDCAYDGKQGLRLALSGGFDVAVLDIMLPGMDGVTLCRKLREEHGSSVPVLMLTARDTEQDKISGLDSGADDYMVKPVDLEELTLRVKALLRRSEIVNSKRLTVGRLTMDEDEHTAYLGGEEINLTVREFDLLYKMLSYPRKTFTRAQLMDEFWDVDSASGSRVVDVYITKLRDKLAGCDDFEIVTVHGLGYKAVLK